MSRGSHCDVGSTTHTKQQSGKKKKNGLTLVNLHQITSIEIIKVKRKDPPTRDKMRITLGKSSTSY
jgi:hypothetical protein